MSKVAICGLGLSVLMMLGPIGCGPWFEGLVGPAGAKPAADACGPCGKPGMRKIEQYLPAGRKRGSTVLLEKAAPEQVRVGETFEYHLKVTNTTEADLLDVTVWDTVMPNFKLAQVTPEPARTKDGWAAWDLGRLAPGQAKLIKMKGAATGVCLLKPCTEVTYRMERVCMPIHAVQPSLTLTRSAPPERLLCDTIPVKLVVRNTGTAQVCNVVVRDPLPEGLRTTDGKTALVFPAGTLNPAESREFTAQVKAAMPGTYVSRAVATADGGLRADAPPTTTVVVKSELSCIKSGPEMSHIGRPITYTITVINGPKVAANRTVLTDALPAGATFVSASDGGKLAAGKVTWRLGTLKPRESKEVSVTVKAAKAGVIRGAATVKASCGTAGASASTTVKGVPAVLLEVIDTEDPIEVGASETYQITVTNQGSAAVTNIAVECTLPPAQQHVRSTGKTKATVKGQVVTFAPLKSLAPKAKAVYKVVVKGIRAADVRFRTTLKTDQMTVPAEETEATRIYE